MKFNEQLLRPAITPAAHAAHKMITIAVGVYGMPEPTSTEPEHIYERFKAFQRLGGYIITGKV